ncbi:hypothetical protein Pmar_PMAR010303, partial [Perkinsus marinus ATCC 50983]
MQTRSSTGTPLKPPSRYIQPKAQPKAKVKPRAKASGNWTSIPKEKARSKGRGTRVQSRKVKAAQQIHQPKDHDHELLSSSPYGVLTGVGLNHLNVAPGCADTSWNGTAREGSEKRRREDLPEH